MSAEVLEQQFSGSLVIRAVSSPRVPNGVVVPAPAELEADIASFPDEVPGCVYISRQGASSIAGSFVQKSPPSAWTS